MSQRPSRISPDSQYDDEIDLRELFRVLWQGKWIVAATTFIAAIISVIIALSLPDIYRAEALLAPASSGDRSGFGAIASQYRGLASFAGINVGNLDGGTDKTALGIEVFRSRKFIGEFVERHDILPQLMASEGWSRSKDELGYDEDLYDVESGVWVRNVRPPKKPEPSIVEAHKTFMGILSISQSSDTGFVRVSIDHYSPYVAKRWLDWLIEDLNSEIKYQDVSEAERSIEYLHEQLQTTSLAELQTVFYQLIEEQTKVIVLANARSEYLFRVIDPAGVAEERLKPNRALICILSVLIGSLIGIFSVFVRHFIEGL